MQFVNHKVLAIIWLLYIHSLNQCLVRKRSNNYFNYKQKINPKHSYYGNQWAEPDWTLLYI